MICQYCGYERAATQASCPVCGSTQPPQPLQEKPMVMSAGQGTHRTPFISPQPTPFPAQRPLTTPREASTPPSGRLLQGQRYRLVERQELQQWSPEVYEARWRAQDRESGREVIVSEIVLPLSGTDLQTFFRAATKTLLKSNELLNVFLEQGHGFFIFAPSTGESLRVRIQRRGTLNEQEAIDCYRQLAEALVFLSKHEPALAHGSIQPEHIIHVGSRWVLTHGSPLVAGDIIQWIPDLKTTRLAAQSSPASDLFALSAAIYYATVGRIPPVDGREQQADLMKAALSPTFAAILLKGIHPRTEMRYQHPSELVEALGRGANDRHEGVRWRPRSGALEQVPQEPLPASASTYVRTLPFVP
jgi:hypothetical protein